MNRPPLGLCVPVQVIRVVDGDTVEILVYGKEVKIRLQGYDAPETWRPKSEEERKRGEEAKQYLMSLLDGVEVYLWVEYSTRLVDFLTLGRLKGHLWAGDVHVAKRMDDLGYVK